MSVRLKDQPERVPAAVGEPDVMSVVYKDET